MGIGQSKLKIEVGSMIKKYLVALVFGSLLAVGCSSSSETKTNVKAANSLPANTTNTNTLIVGDPDSVAPTPGTLDQIPVAEMPEGTNANTTTLNQRRKMVDNPGVPKSMSVPAGENSEISSTMDKQGNFVETRRFNAHSQLDKVERTYLSTENSSLKIYLKGGKVVTVSGNQVKNIAAASSADFLALAGIKTRAVSNAGTGAKTK